jgi:hypothetical protein
MTLNALPAPILSDRHTGLQRNDVLRSSR